LFVLVTVDHLFGEGVLERLLAAGEPAVLVDPIPDRAAWLEGCRVRVVDGQAVGFGKHLDAPAAYRCRRRAGGAGEARRSGGGGRRIPAPRVAPHRPKTTLGVLVESLRIASW
jgi:hypothetical protein